MTGQLIKMGHIKPFFLNSLLFSTIKLANKRLKQYIYKNKITMETIKLKIESDGTTSGTKLMTEDGKMVGCVQKIVWMASTEENFTSAIIEILDIPIIAKVEEAELQKVSEMIKEKENDEHQHN